MIDLHTHTTASDGALRPADLVHRAAAAGIRTLAITDHDTLDGLDEAHAAASACGVALIDGIEVTAVHDGRDVHVLGYFLDRSAPDLLEFLRAQRTDRIRRVREMVDRLAALGVPVDPEPLLRLGSDAGRSVGRPHVAAALVAAGHVRTRDEAFEKFLEKSRPAFVPRCGAAPRDAIATLRQAGAVVSLAHPALTRIDDIIPSLVSSGLGALEARHSDHDAADERHYRELAKSLGLGVSGGSDFHGDDGHRKCALGAVTLPDEDFADLQARRA